MYQTKVNKKYHFLVCPLNAWIESKNMQQRSIAKSQFQCKVDVVVEEQEKSKWIKPFL
jgi:hypothetical protein